MEIDEIIRLGTQTECPTKFLRQMSRKFMVRVLLDILYLLEISFEDRLKVQEVGVKSLELKSIHQVKELYNTEEGRKVWDFCLESYPELTVLALNASISKDLARGQSLSD